MASILFRRLIADVEAGVSSGNFIDGIAPGFNRFPLGSNPNSSACIFRTKSSETKWSEHTKDLLGLQLSARLHLSCQTLHNSGSLGNLKVNTIF